MTKLMEWLSAASAFFALWYSLISGFVKHPLIQENMGLILISPIFVVIIFGLYALTVVLYRVYTFNNCDSAFLELQRQIREANRELVAKGLTW